LSVGRARGATIADRSVSARPKKAPMEPIVDEHGPRNDELCAACGGLCCCLYLAHDENGDYIGEGWLPDYIELWLGRFVESGALVQLGDEYRAGAAGVEPLQSAKLIFTGMVLLYLKTLVPS